MPTQPHKFKDSFGFDIEIGSWVLYPWQSGAATILFGRIIGTNRSGTKLQVRLVSPNRYFWCQTQRKTLHLEWMIEEPRPVQYPKNCIVISDEVFERLAPSSLQAHIKAYMPDLQTVLPQHEALIDAH